MQDNLILGQDSSSRASTDTPINFQSLTSVVTFEAGGSVYPEASDIPLETPREPEKMTSISFSLPSKTDAPPKTTLKAVESEMKRVKIIIILCAVLLIALIIVYVGVSNT